jgi:hypothetical protein
MGLLKFLARLFGLGRSNQVEKAESQPDYDSDTRDLDGLEVCEAASDPAPAVDTVERAAEQAAGAMLAADGDDLDDLLSAAFLGDSPAEAAGSPAPVAQPVQEGGPRDLFAGIASNYARPVKNFMCDLKRGEATKQWIEICLPVTNTIIEAAESLDLTTVAERMSDFGAALTIAQGEQGHVLRGESRDLLLSCYDELIELLPETFVLEERDERRESIIIHSLLQQIDGMGHVTFEKLYGAGLTTLDALVLANKEDLSVVAGVPEWLCEKVCQKVQRHHEQLTGDAGDGGQSFLRARLAELVKELRTHHEIFEGACAEPTPSKELDATKRDSRRDRQACALRVNVLLAEMGNLDLIEEIEKLALGRRTEKLETFVQTFNDEIVAAPVLVVDDNMSSTQAPTRR